MVSTPAGSTAYNLSVHGPILSINSKKPVSPNSPHFARRWKSKIVNDKSKIVIKNLNPNKRPVSAVADNQEVRNAQIIKLKLSELLNLIFIQNRVYKKKSKLSKLERNFLIK